MAIQQRECLKQKEDELIETRQYVDELVLMVMEKAPHLLEQGRLSCDPTRSRDPSRAPAVSSSNGIASKSARKRPAWQT